MSFCRFMDFNQFTDGASRRCSKAEACSWHLDREQDRCSTLPEMEMGFCVLS